MIKRHIYTSYGRWSQGDKVPGYRFFTNQNLIRSGIPSQWVHPGISINDILMKEESEGPDPKPAIPPSPSPINPKKQKYPDTYNDGGLVKKFNERLSVYERNKKLTSGGV